MTLFWGFAANRFAETSVSGQVGTIQGRFSRQQRVSTARLDLMEVGFCLTTKARHEILKVTHGGFRVAEAHITFSLAARSAASCTMRTITNSTTLGKPMTIQGMAIVVDGTIQLTLRNLWLTLRHFSADLSRGLTRIGVEFAQAGCWQACCLQLQPASVLRLQAQDRRKRSIVLGGHQACHVVVKRVNNGTS